MLRTLTDWYFRRRARATFDLLHGGGGFLAGLDPEDRTIRVRVGRVAWMLGKTAVAEVLAGSPDPLRDLEAMETFAAAVGRIPRDCFDRAFEVGSLSGSGSDRNRGRLKLPRSRWGAAAPLLKPAIEIARSGGGFELIYHPSQTEARACSYDRPDEIVMVRAAEITLRPMPKAL